MTVNVHQTLHGYSNGHQLLASSIQLDLIDHKLLLFQSDLSGPTLIQGFESYISGFPLKSANYYAFSRTWYAEEMKRPGCVWTHTILIAYADLGRLIDLKQLKKIFHRPENGRYQAYKDQIEIQEIENEVQGLSHDREVLKERIATLLYENHQNSLLIPAANSNDLDDILIDIWADQWPRLRRNFLFCSGSLSLRSIEKKLFDLQVVPIKLVNQIEKQSKSLSVLGAHTQINPLVASVKPRSNKILTGLTWLIGSDVEGVRENYFRLLEVVSLLSKSTSIESVAELMLKLFPKPNEAVVFKSRLFGRSLRPTLNVTEFELLQYLLFTPDKKLTFLNLTTLELEARMKELLKEEQITVIKFAELWSSAKPGRISEKIWEDLDLSTENALLLSTRHPDLVALLIKRYPSIAANVAFWQIPARYQLEVIRLIKDEIAGADGIKYVSALISAKSDILLQALRYIGVNSLPTFLNAYVQSTNNDPTYLQPLLNEYFNEFKSWIRKQNPADLHDKLLEATFISLNYERLQRLDLSSTAWILSYRSITSKNSKVNEVFAACTILSIGLQNRISHADELVIESFNTVYYFGLSGKLGTSIWQMINRDDYHYQDEPESIGFWSMFTKKKKDRVPPWDYCESLIRIGANSFVKNEWMSQSFALAFNDPKVFERVVDYLVTYSKGQRYLGHISSDADNGRLKLSKFQKDILNNMLQ